MEEEVKELPDKYNLIRFRVLIYDKNENLIFDVFKPKTSKIGFKTTLSIGYDILEGKMVRYVMDDYNNIKLHALKHYIESNTVNNVLTVEEHFVVDYE